MKSTANGSSNSVILFVTSLAVFLTTFIAAAINVGIPAMGRDFNMNVILLSWVSTSFTLTMTVFMLPLGRFADIWGRTRVFLIGGIVFGLGCLIAAISINPQMLIISRVVQAIGCAAISSPAVAILISAFPGRERGRVLGINTGAVYIGLSIGPFLGGILTDFAGWRSIFWVSFVLSVIVIVIAIWKLQGESVKPEKTKLDSSGTLMYMFAVVLIMFGLTSLPEIIGAVLIAAGIIIGIIFVWWENHKDKPLLDLSLFRKSRGFNLSILAALANYGGTFAASFLLSLYLQYVKGYGPEIAGLILIASPAMQTIVSPICGRLSDRVEPRFLATIGMIATGIAIGMFAFLGPNTSIAYIIVGLIILGFGIGVFSSPNTNAVLGYAEPRVYGVASAILGTMRQFGMMISMAIAMLMFALFIGRVEISADRVPGLIQSERITFLICTVMCFASVIVSVSRGKSPQKAVAGQTSH